MVTTQLPKKQMKFGFPREKMKAKPTILVTNVDGFNAPGLEALVQVLVSTKLYRVQVCAPDSCVYYYYYDFPLFFLCFCMCLCVSETVWLLYSFYSF